MHAYPQMTEYDILSKDWEWVDYHRKAIEERRNEERRFKMLTLMTSVSAAFNGGEAMDKWNQIYESLFTPEQLKAVRAEEERALKEAEEAAREEKIREWLARKEAEAEAQGQTQTPPEEPKPRGGLVSSA